MHNMIDPGSNPGHGYILNDAHCFADISFEKIFYVKQYIPRLLQHMTQDFLFLNKYNMNRFWLLLKNYWKIILLTQ